MKSRTITVHEGELLGSIDWDYDFAAHGWDQGGSMNPEALSDRVQTLHQIEDGIARGETWQATTDGGWPRVGWGKVLEVGMYDGWPYWKPTPSVLIETRLGAEWASVFLVKEARKL